MFDSAKYQAAFRAFSELESLLSRAGNGHILRDEKALEAVPEGVASPWNDMPDIEPPRSGPAKVVVAT